MSNDVYIVMRNNKVDEVFDNRVAAENHKANLIKEWHLAEIIERPVKSV